MFSPPSHALKISIVTDEDLLYFFPEIYLTIQGIAKCQWTDTGEKKDSEGKPRTRIIKFAGKQIYLNSITNLVEKDEGLYCYSLFKEFTDF